jgi:magnesium-transporting ATPase (P-type)
MARLYACPFCRQLFTEGEVAQCPDCAIAVEPVDELPPSYDAELVEPEPPTPPEYELVPMTYAGRMRGVLLLLAAAGLGAFFAPWLRESLPEIRVLSGFEFARKLAWLWAAPVAWFIMFALVLSRRTIYHMRGARLAVGILAVMVLMTVALRIGLLPEAGTLVPRSYQWGWGLYASGLLGACALGAALRFGGSPDSEPPPEQRQEDEPLH